jgi:hypothetical protein
MSNKKETPVRWLVEQYNNYRDGFLSKSEINKALQMEAQKQQKYDEMLAMLEICKRRTSSFDLHRDLEQLIKEAKEL